MSKASKEILIVLWFAVSILLIVDGIAYLFLTGDRNLPSSVGTDSNTAQAVGDTNEPMVVETESILAQARRDVNDLDIGPLKPPLEWTDRETGL